MKTRARQYKKGKYKGSDEESEESEEEFEVEKILAKRKNLNTVQYLLKWKGFPDSENSWQYKGKINCSNLIKEFENNLKNQIREKKQKNSKENIKIGKESKTDVINSKEQNKNKTVKYTKKEVDVKDKKGRSTEEKIKVINKGDGKDVKYSEEKTRKGNTKEDSKQRKEKDKKCSKEKKGKEKLNKERKQKHDDIVVQENLTSSRSSCSIYDSKRYIRGIDPYLINVGPPNSRPIIISNEIKECDLLKRRRCDDYEPQIVEERNCVKKECDSLKKRRQCDVSEKTAVIKNPVLNGYRITKKSTNDVSEKTAAIKNPVLNGYRITRTSTNGDKCNIQHDNNNLTWLLFSQPLPMDKHSQLAKYFE